MRSAIALGIVLLITLTVVSSVPLIPEITANIQVSTTPNHHPALNLLYVVYRKVSLLAASPEPKDRIQVIASTGAAPTSSSPVHYYLSAVVQYGNQMVIQGGADLGDGSYLIKASFWPRQEEPNTPYVVTITVSQGGYYYATVESTITPR
jgi:hypothetical protein